MTTAGPRSDLSNGASAIAGLTAFIASRDGDAIAAEFKRPDFLESRSHLPQEVTA